MPGGSFEFDGPQGHQSMNWSVADARFSGIYDPALATFRSMSGSLGGMTMASKDAIQDLDASIGPGTFALTGGPSAGGGVDFTLSEAFTNFAENVRVADPSSGANLPFSVKAATLSIDASGQGYRTRALLDLLAFGVANADKAKITANQAELKTRLLAALPVWNRIDGSYRFGDFTTETPVGSFGAKAIAVGFGMDGADRQRNDHLQAERRRADRAGATRAGLEQAAAADRIRPERSGVGFDLDGMARKLIDALDLNREPPVPEEVTAAIGAEFMAKPPKVVISRSTVKGGDTEVAAEGEVTFVAGKPEANVAFEVAGYDSVIETVKQAANDQPEFGQYLAFALAAKGFAKTLPEGRLRWEFLVKARRIGERQRRPAEGPGSAIARIPPDRAQATGNRRTGGAACLFQKSARCGVKLSTSRPASSALTPCTAFDGTMNELPAASVSVLPSIVTSNRPSAT